LFESGWVFERLRVVDWRELSPTGFNGIVVLIMKDDALPPKLFVDEVVLMTLIELAFGMLPTLEV
jgi:hypothetical protein